MSRESAPQSLFRTPEQSNTKRRRNTLAIAAGTLALLALLPGCTDKKATGPCEILTSKTTSVPGYDWYYDGNEPIHGAYLLFTKDDVARLMRGDEGNLDHLPQGDELKVYINPKDRGEDALMTSIQDLYSYSTALNSIEEQDSPAIKRGAVGFQLLTGDCHLNIPL